MTDTWYLDETQVAAELRKIAAEKPDFRYTDTDEYEMQGTCNYATNDGVPSCIVGHLVKRVLGDEALAVLHSVEEAVGEFSVAGSEWPSSIGLTEAAGDMLWRAQNKQDSGSKWEDAVYAAIHGTEEPSRR